MARGRRLGGGAPHRAPDADAWGYVAGADLTEPLALLDRVLAMLWRMTHPRPPLPAN